MYYPKDWFGFLFWSKVYFSPYWTNYGKCSQLSWLKIDIKCLLSKKDLFNLLISFVLIAKMHMIWNNPHWKLLFPFIFEVRQFNKDHRRLTFLWAEIKNLIFAEENHLDQMKNLVYRFPIGLAYCIKLNT